MDSILTSATFVCRCRTPTKRLPIRLRCNALRTRVPHRPSSWGLVPRSSIRTDDLDRSSTFCCRVGSSTPRVVDGGDGVTSDLGGDSLFRGPRAEVAPLCVITGALGGQRIVARARADDGRAFKLGAGRTCDVRLGTGTGGLPSRPITSTRAGVFAVVRGELAGALEWHEGPPPGNE